MSNASNFVKGVDLSFAVIFGISLFFLIGITAVMIYFVIRYRRKKNPKATNIEGNNTLEIIWTVIPTILVLIMFYFGWAGYAPMRKPPKDAMPVKAIGQMWSWTFEYPNGKRSSTLVVPKDKPVKLDLVSLDVLHSLYIPAFRVKEDVVPGKNNFMWFIAQQEGSYDLFCAEFCGDRHSYMLSKVEVVPESEFNEWLIKSIVPEDEHPGLTLIKQNACITCHSQDGSKIVGPSFKGLYGKKEVVINANGDEIELVADDAYIEQSIYEPDTYIVKDYDKGLMISYKDRLSQEDIQKIVEYIKTLK